MIKTFIPLRIVSLGFLALLLLSANRATAGDVLRLATFNCQYLVRRSVHVKFGLDLDARNWTVEQAAEWEQPGFRDVRFGEAVKSVATVIHKLNADVISLCEVGDEADVEELRHEVSSLGLNYPHSAVSDSSDLETGQHVAVLSKRRLDAILKTIPGQEGFDRELIEDETEVTKGMQVVFRVADQPVHLFVVHLANEPGRIAQDAPRVAQASIVRRNYLGLLNDGKLVIVAGDLNDYRGQPTLRRIRGRDDIWPDLIQTGAASFFPLDKYSTRWTVEFEGERLQMDHVLIAQSIKVACKPGGIRAEVVPVTQRISGADHPASDHRPVVVTMEFR